MALEDINAQFERYLTVLERDLPTFLPDVSGLNRRVVDAMSYSLLSGGKRIRAVLLMSCYNLFSDDFVSSVPYAAALEMVHAYSLIHDDLPCMDDDDMRRGRPSCHIEFDEATAVLAGDGLLTLAFETASRKENSEIFGSDRVVAAIRAISRAAGANGMVGGQIIDMENEKRDVDLNALILTDTKKTGALMTAACEVGCILGGADEKITRHVTEYASKLGLAFQILDDILDVTGDSKELGKPVGSDLKGGKPTYASLLGVEKAAETAKNLTAEAIGEIRKTGLNVEFLCGLAEMLAVRKR
ncbi:MAG: polyprenyl synthetase family protein [Oscillospiraceae bacterium]|nr:polyprenyl synthetase family protein [Oscillospiraceae bacterium]